MTLKEHLQNAYLPAEKSLSGLVAKSIALPAFPINDESTICQRSETMLLSGCDWQQPKRRCKFVSLPGASGKPVFFHFADQHCDKPMGLSGLINVCHELLMVMNQTAALQQRHPVGLSQEHNHIFQAFMP